MRLAFHPDSLVERVGLALGKVPLPAGRTFNAMAVSRSVGVAQRTGALPALVGHERSAVELADLTGLHAEPLRMMLDLLAGEGLLRRRGDRYTVARSALRWLDPASGTYLGTFLAHTADYWPWWADLEGVLRGAPGIDLHAIDADDPSWPTYIRGQYELARLSAGAVARAIDLPSGARSVLDVGGGHGWYAAAVCARHPGLRATVLDLPGSVAVGQEIMKETGMDGVVTHTVADLRAGDLGGPFDAVLCFSVLHHLRPDQIDHLLARVHACLRPGGTFAVLDLFRPDPGRRPRSSAAVFELFFHLTSGVDTPSEQGLTEHLERAGFTRPRRRDLPTVPDLRLYQAKRVA